jgi:hypothetical protein
MLHFWQLLPQGVSTTAPVYLNDVIDRIVHGISMLLPMITLVVGVV